MTPRRPAAVFGARASPPGRYSDKANGNPPSSSHPLIRKSTRSPATCVTEVPLLCASKEPDQRGCSIQSDGSTCEALTWSRRSVTAGVLQPSPAARWYLGHPMPATVPAGSCGFSAAGYRDARFCDPEAPGWAFIVVRVGPRVDLPGSRQFARPLCVTHRPIRRLPGWLAPMSQESPQALPRALAALGYGDGFWSDGVWRSSGTM